MRRKYFVVGGLLFFTPLVIGTGNFAQRGSDPQMTPNGESEFPSGFRGVNPPPAIPPDSVLLSPTPTMTPSSDTAFRSRSVGETYAVIPTGDVEMLQELSTSRRRSQRSRIRFTSSREYLISETLVVLELSRFTARLDVTFFDRLDFPDNKLQYEYND